jgi:hypothetical protein
MAAQPNDQFDSSRQSEPRPCLRGLSSIALFGEKLSNCHPIRSLRHKLSIKIAKAGHPGIDSCFPLSFKTRSQLALLLSMRPGG